MPLRRCSGNWASPWNGNTIGALLYHVAAIETDWVFTEVLEMEAIPDEVLAWFPVDVREEGGRLSPVTGMTLDDHLQRLEQARASTLEAFRGMSVAEYKRPRRLEQYEVTPEWVVHHLTQHEAEHRGQMGEIRMAAVAAIR